MGILAFEVGQRRFAVDLRFVREVLPLGNVTPVARWRRPSTSRC
jgi:chemotaxis signal transduction protein